MQKIYDIIPPEMEEEPRGEEGMPETEKVSKPSSSKRKFWIFLVCTFLLIFICAVVFIEPKAEINIWPKTEVQSFTVPVQLNKDLEIPDVSKKLIPGRVAEIEKVVSRDFSASQTATKETKAEGTLRVYNNYSVYPQAFVAQTRFMSDSGKIFVTPERMVVPGKTLKNGKWEPGSIDIKAVAVAGGSEYNISSSGTEFSIPGLKGDPSYTFFRVVSLTPMEGGSVAKVYKVSEEDIKKANDEVDEEAIAEAKTYLIKEIPQGWFLLEETIKAELVETFPLAKAGQETQSFTVQAKAKSWGWIFKEEDLEKFAKDYFLLILESGKAIYEPSLRAAHSPLLESAGGSQVILNLDLSAEFYSGVDTETLKRRAAGSKTIQIQRDILQNFSQIEKVEVKISPFWVDKAPTKTDNIKINLIFE